MHLPEHRDVLPMFNLIWRTNGLLVSRLLVFRRSDALHDVLGLFKDVAGEAIERLNLVGECTL